jgi:hypothetical protein
MGLTFQYFSGFGTRPALFNHEMVYPQFTLEKRLTQ